MNDKELTLFCPVWGRKFLDMFRDYALPSLMLPGNLPACGLEKLYVEHAGQGREFPEAQQILGEALKPLGIPIELTHHELGSAPNIFHGLEPAMRLSFNR